jgi:putative nucleotidyltransferase-like protein
MTSAPALSGRGEHPRSTQWRRWHEELRAAASMPRPSDPRDAAELSSRIQVCLMALVPAVRSGIVLGTLPPLPDWLDEQLTSLSIDSLYYLAGGSSGNGLQPIYQRMADRQTKLAQEVVGQLAARDIAPVALKGIELRARVFGGHAISQSTDIDLLVRRDQLETARQILLGYGFQHAEYSARSGCLAPLSPEQVKSHEARHYELYPLCRLTSFPLTAAEADRLAHLTMAPLFVHDGQGTFLDVVDLHRTIFIGIEVDSLIARAVPSTIAGAVTLSPTDQIWTTALRFYLESSASYDDPKHRDLAYLIALLDHQQVDWRALVDFVTEADIRPALFYTLRFLDQLGVIQVPAWVLDDIHVRRGSAHLDFGCRATRALGLVEKPPDVFVQPKGGRVRSLADHRGG